MNIRHIIVVAVLGLSSAGAQALLTEYPQTEEEFMQAFLKLEPEIESGEHSILNANQRFDLPEEWLLFKNDNAKNFLFLSNGVHYPDVGAVAANSELTHQLVFSYFDEGYVRDTDWEDMDPEKLLEGVTESTVEANAERQANNLPPLNITGWIQEPIYDREKHTAYWAIGAEQEGVDVVNAIAIKLGRQGFTKIVWVTEHSQGLSLTDNILYAGLSDHTFEEGFQYSDFSTGDKLAGIGLASLVAVTAGSKKGKGVVVGLLATLLILAKKLWFVLLLPFVFLWNKIVAAFGRKERL